MNIKRCIKLITVFTLMITIFSICNLSVAAFSFEGLLDSADDFIKNGEIEEKISQDSLEDLSGNLYNILLIAGTVIASIVGLILGILFVTGSVEQKGKVKEMLIPYLAGCLVLFGAFTIWKVVVDTLQKVS